MKLRVFQSDKGDCLLLTDRAERCRMLIDGGMRQSYRQFVAPALGELAAAGKPLDVVCVSHIDQDHIAGVLQMFDDAVAWKVHDFQLRHDNPTHPEPESPRPPKVNEVWHNAFHEQLEANAGPVGSLLAAGAAVFSGVGEETDLLGIGLAQGELATSIPEAIRLSRRLSAEQLNVPLNQRFGGKLAFVRTDAPPPSPIRMGRLKLSVIGPFDKDIDELRRNWNTWLAENQAILNEISRQGKRDAERLGTSDVQVLLERQIALAKELGDRTKVTPPNLASLMLLVEEGKKRLLLTGDGHSADILKGLAFHRKLDADGRLHVNVLKVQHHGSEHNIDAEFVSKITADHYVFCGNGEHQNPDLRVVDLILNSRLGEGPGRSRHPRADDSFTCWFNSSAEATRRQPAKDHMRELAAHLTRRSTDSGGRLNVKFLTKDEPSFELII